MSSAESFTSQRRGLGWLRLPPSLVLPPDDADDNLLGEIDAIAARPVFIMGLHRSGTTFLYDCMARSFPLARLTLYHLLHYEGLLVSRRDGLERQQRADLNAAINSLGIIDRSMDSIAVNDNTLEEYGFVLRRLSQSFRITDENVPQFDQLCRKLIAVQPPAQAVLLKNPWDNGNGRFILERFPEARFVFISRDPLAILNSQLNAQLTFLEDPQPYLRLLLETGPQPYSGVPPVLVNAAAACLRGLRRIVGADRVVRATRNSMAKSLVQDLAACQADLAALPTDRVVETDFAELVADPEAVMRRLPKLLGLRMTGDQEQVRARPQIDLNPVVAEFRPELERLLSEAGV